MGTPPRNLGTKALTAVLAALLLAIQYPLWFGKGSVLRAWELDRQLTRQRGTNITLAARNAALDAEVRDLKSGTDAIEERARADLGMVRPGEVFFRVLDDPVPGKPATPGH